MYRDPEPQYINQGVFECHNVHLKRDMPGQSFGLSLIGRPHYSTGTAIGGIVSIYISIIIQLLLLPIYFSSFLYIYHVDDYFLNVCSLNYFHLPTFLQLRDFYATFWYLKSLRSL